MLSVRSAATPDCRNFIPFHFPCYSVENYCLRPPEFKNNEAFVLTGIIKSDETDRVIH